MYITKRKRIVGIKNAQKSVYFSSERNCLVNLVSFPRELISQQLVSSCCLIIKCHLQLLWFGLLSALALSLYKPLSWIGLLARPEQLLSRPCVFSIVLLFLIWKHSVICYTQSPFFITMVAFGRPGDRWT